MINRIAGIAVAAGVVAAICWVAAGRGSYVSMFDDGQADTVVHEVPCGDEPDGGPAERTDSLQTVGQPADMPAR